MRARSADNVVLIDTVAADPDRADENAVAIKRKTAGKNRDAVGQIEPDAVSQRRRTWIDRVRKSDVGFSSRKPGKLILFGEKWPRTIAVDARRIKALRQKSDATRGHGNVQTEAKKIVPRIKHGGARFLHRHVPAE